MSVILFLEDDLSLNNPHEFTEIDQRDFIGFVTDNRIDILANYLRMDLAALKRVALDYADVEELMEEYEYTSAEAHALVAESKGRNDLVWQHPAQLISTLSQLSAALERIPDPFPNLLLDRPDTYYLIDGYFQQDLTDLLRMAEWAQAQGATRVRLRELCC
jgi:hypothetical protein